MAVVKGLIEVASNAVLDVLVRDVAAPEGPARDGWGANVQVLAKPVELALGVAAQPRRISSAAWGSA